MTLSLCCVGPNHFITLLPGSVALNAIKTTMVLPRTHEMQRTKVMPNAVCRSMQDHSDGRPIKVREHRKHSFNDSRSRKLSSELFAFTIGVSLCIKKMIVVRRDRKTPKQPNPLRSAPVISLYERYSEGLGIHWFFWSFGQSSGRQLKQSRESAE